MKDFVANSIYRHFKGGLYLAHELFTSADGKAGVKQFVAYTSLIDGRKWVRDLEEFLSEVPEDRENPYGQKHRFELIKDFNNPLSTASTQALQKELSTRSDVSVSVLSEDSMFIDEYVVGRVRGTYIETTEEGDQIEEQLVIDTVHDQFSDAVARLERKPDCTIFRRVTYRVSL